MALAVHMLESVCDAWGTGAQDDAIKHVEHPHKTRIQILSPGANNSTLREKFSAQALSATMENYGSGSTYA